jgi:predicted dehydrogenase
MNITQRSFAMSLGIAQVGLGSIARYQRQAYNALGLEVVAGWNRSPAGREKFAAETPGARAYEHLEDLLADPRVGVIDLTTAHDRPARIPLIEKIAAAGKPVLIQKPMAMTYAEALEIVEILESHNCPAMVNQNMCFMPSVTPLREQLPLIGRPFLAQFELRMCYDYPPDHWMGKDLRWWTIANTVHAVSLIHFLFGPPRSVYARLGRDPSQAGTPHEGFGNLALAYDNGLTIWLLSTGTYYGQRQKPYTQEEFWIQGDAGIIDWRPEGEMFVTLHAERPKARRIELTGHWFPDALGATMLHFIRAIERGAEPLCSVQDNLHVMAICEAAYQSHASWQAVDVGQIMGGRYDPRPSIAKETPT